jgi:hypothetical protein
MTTPNNATHGAANAAFSFSTTPSNTMNYKTHNQSEIEYNFTCLQGHVDAGYKELVNLFGKPTGGDKHKVDAEWVLLFDDGMVATIYNYKNGKNYNGEDGLATEKIRDWHVGGHDQKVVDRVQIILDLHREGKQSKDRDDVDSAFESVFDIMDTIKGVKGQEYARTVETGMLGKKMQDLFQTALGLAVARDAIPDGIADLMNDAFNHMLAKQISLCANNGGLVKDANKSDAEELMGWVDKLMDAEQNAAKTIMSAERKRKG